MSIRDKAVVALFFLVMNAVCVGILVYIYTKWSYLPPIRADGVGYHAYLPGLLIHGDITFRSILDAYPFQPTFANQGGVFFRPEVGSYVPYYTLGVALVQAPAFIVAFILAPLFGYPADGYSWPFQLANIAAGLYCLNIGMACLLAVLRRHFSFGISLFTAVLTVFGTSLFQYATHDGSFSHIYSFGAVAAFLWVQDTFRHDDMRRGVLSGIILGIIILIRVPNGIVGLLYLFYGVNTIADLRDRFLTLRAWRIHIVAGVLLIATAGLQAAYWYGATGHLFYDTYGPGFMRWFDPKIPEILFSIRKGLFVYTPLFLLAMIGFWPMRRMVPAAIVPTVMLVPLHIYITSIWAVWWYGGSLGQRPFLDVLPLYALGVASLLAVRMPTAARAGLYALAALMVPLMLFLSYCYMNQVLPYEGLTPEELEKLPAKFEAFFGFWPF